MSSSDAPLTPADILAASYVSRCCEVMDGVLGMLSRAAEDQDVETVCELAEALDRLSSAGLNIRDLAEPPETC